jgi:LacI family transcriptional regulator, galactose operon repressor
MVTIKDIAYSSGVGVSTVSEVLNYKPRALKVTEATKKRIFKAARKLNYTPNIVARGLRTGRSMQIALLIDRIEGSMFPYIIQGIEDVLYARGYSASFFIYRSEQDLVKRARLIKQRQVDGILLYPDTRIPVETFRDLLKGYPVVTFAKKLHDSNIPCVRVSGEEIGYLASKHLFESGHKKIAFYCKKDHSREKGCLRALAEMGLKKNSVQFIYRQWGFEQGREFIREIVKHDNITGVYAYTDTCAAGMIYEATALGIKIPEKLSIIGSNNLPIASQVFPQITTVSQPKKEQGSEAAKMLLGMIENKNICSDKMLRPSLIVRASTASI